MIFFFFSFYVDGTFSPFGGTTSRKRSHTGFPLHTVVKGTWGTRLDTQARRFRPPAPEQQSMGGPSFRRWFLGSFGPSAQAGGASGERLLNASLWESIFLLNRKRRNLPVTVSRKQRAIALPRNLKKGLAEQTGVKIPWVWPQRCWWRISTSNAHFQIHFLGTGCCYDQDNPCGFGRSWSLEC